MEEYSSLIKVTIALTSAFLLNYLLRRLIKLYIRRYAKKVSADPTSFSFLKNSVGFIIFSSLIVYLIQFIPGLRNIGTALFAGAGILAAILGFAAQKAFANIIGGIFILIFRPFRVGDVIYIGLEYRGIVEEITLRHIVIKNYENRRIIIPNGIISDETIVNSSIADVRIKKHYEISVGYDADIDLAIAILKEEAEKHPLTINPSNEDDQKTEEAPKVTVRIISIGEYAIVLRAWIWAANTDDAFIISCDLNYSVKKRYDEANIDIPYPYRNVIIKDGQSKMIQQTTIKQ